MNKFLILQVQFTSVAIVYESAENNSYTCKLHLLSVVSTKGRFFVQYAFIPSEMFPTKILGYSVSPKVTKMLG